VTIATFPCSVRFCEAACEAMVEWNRLCSWDCWLQYGGLVTKDTQKGVIMYASSKKRHVDGLYRPCTKTGSMTEDTLSNHAKVCMGVGNYPVYQETQVQHPTFTGSSVCNAMQEWCDPTYRANSEQVRKQYSQVRAVLISLHQGRIEEQNRIIIQL
jgi:hypothetical protein